MVQNIKIYRSTTSEPVSLDFGSPAVSFTGGRAKLFVGNSLNNPIELTVGSNIKNTPSGNITATNVQSAIDDLDSRLINGSLDASSHRNLDQLVHNPFSDSGYLEALPVDSFSPTSIILWTNVGKTIKRYEELITYDGNGDPTQVVARWYDGTTNNIKVGETMTLTPSFGASGSLNNVTGIVS